MTKMQKGFMAMLLTMVLAIGAVASADSRQTDGLQQAAPEQRASAPAQAETAKLKRVGATLTVVDLTQVVADDGQATFAIEAGAVLRNNSREALDLREVRVMLQDESGKVMLPARIMLESDAKGVLEPGQSAEVKLLFAEVPTDAGRLKLSMNAPNGGAVINGIGIEISCSWPPLRCKITITFDF